MFNNKSTFKRTVSDQFRTSSKWRATRFQRFGNDARNATAAARLLELESEISISDDAWNFLAPLVSDPTTCLAAISETNRDVKFRTDPTDFTAWLENLHSNLTRH